jgi:hypothetical protein
MISLGSHTLSAYQPAYLPAPPARARLDLLTLSLQNRTSMRFSTYSMQAPSVAATVQSTDSTHADIRVIESGLQRMENKALTQQRVTLSEEKTANMSKIALGAKLERALDRRMSSQDAVMRPRKSTKSNIMSEKSAIEA